MTRDDLFALTVGDSVCLVLGGVADELPVTGLGVLPRGKASERAVWLGYSACASVRVVLAVDGPEVRGRQGWGAMP